MKIASVWHGADGYLLRVHEVRFLSWLEEQITEAVCKVSCGYLCAICLCNKPLMQWAWRAGWGRREGEDQGLTHSLGYLLFRLGQRTWLSSAQELYTHPLTFDEVVSNFPDSRLEDDDDGENYTRGVMIKKES